LEENLTLSILDTKAKRRILDSLCLLGKSQLLEKNSVLLELRVKGSFSIDSHQGLCVGYSGKTFNNITTLAIFVGLFLVLFFSASQWHCANA
jgi:hypothetical protein